MATASPSPVKISFDRGSLIVEVSRAGPQSDLPDFLSWDGRVGALRCHAIHYRRLVRHFTLRGVPFGDFARNYGPLEAAGGSAEQPYPFQREALTAWSRGKRGAVELPTGSGKTRLALMAIQEVARATLVLVPTLELVAQWCAVLEQALGLTPGAIGGGSFQISPLTVCTYASAYRHAEKFGDRFGLVVFDECHHLAGVGYARIAEVLLAPYRLGLSATMERADQRHHELDHLIGPVVYRKAISELSGEYLAEYRVATRYAVLSAAERVDYDRARETYLAFARGQGLPLASARDWRRFIFSACRTPAGRDALAAYYRQRQIAFAAEDKFKICAELLHEHRGRRALIFTNDNATAFEVSRRFLLPLITHQTKVPERRAILANFRNGSWPVVVTSKVLNEGVDVPSAAVAIILSGNASVREHVQRLGRILRRDGGKQAVLYEVLTRHTTEEGTSIRRRRHDAYR